MIEQDLFTFLSTTVGISSLVSTRVYPTKMPPVAVASGYPAITYFKVSGVRETDMDGDSNLAHPRFQINCWGRTYASAKAVAAAVTTALHAKRMTMGSSTVGASFQEDESDILDPALNLQGSTDQIYGVRLDYTIWNAQ